MDIQHCLIALVIPLLIPFPRICNRSISVNNWSSVSGSVSVYIHESDGKITKKKKKKNRIKIIFCDFFSKVFKNVRW